MFSPLLSRSFTTFLRCFPRIDFFYSFFFLSNQMQFRNEKSGKKSMNPDGAVWPDLLATWKPSSVSSFELKFIHTHDSFHAHKSDCRRQKGVSCMNERISLLD